LKQILQQNGYNKKEVNSTINKHSRDKEQFGQQPQEELNKRSFSIFSYVKGITESAFEQTLFKI